MNKVHKIVLIGAPGVGKGTFSNLIASKTGWKHLSVGDLLRDEVKSKTKIGNEISSYMQKGSLTPDGVINKLVSYHIKKITKTYDDNITNKQLINEWGRAILLDGYPRTINQAEELNNIDNDNGNDNNDNNIIAVQIVLEKWVAIEKLLNRKQCQTCGGNFNTANIVSEFAILYCTVLHCTALHCTVLYCTVLHCTALYCTVLHCTVVLYCFVSYHVVQ
jgi:adenylate kinase